MSELDAGRNRAIHLNVSQLHFSSLFSIERVRFFATIATISRYRNTDIPILIEIMRFEDQFQSSALAQLPPQPPAPGLQHDLPSFTFGVFEHNTVEDRFCRFAPTPRTCF